MIYLIKFKTIFISVLLTFCFIIFTWIESLASLVTFLFVFVGIFFPSLLFFTFYFFVAGIKHCDKGDLCKKEFILACNSRDIRDMLGKAEKGSLCRCSNHKANQVKRKCSEAFNHKVAFIICFSQEGHHMGTKCSKAQL